MTRKDAAIIGALVVLAIFARMYRISDESIWFDESVSVRNLGDDQSLGEFLAAASIADPAQDPLYFALLHGWTRLAGRGEIACRVLSVAFGVATVVFVYLAGRIYFAKRREAFSGALLACMSVSYIYYSQEVRMYSLYLVLAALSIYSLIHYFEHNDRRSFGLTIVANMLLVWTHLCAPLLLIAEGIAMVAHCRKRWRTLFGWVAPQAVNAIVWWVTWARHMRFDKVAAATDWLHGLDWSLAAFGRAIADTISFSSVYPFTPLVATVVMTGAVAGVVWLARGWRATRGIPAQDLLIVLIALTPIIMFGISKWYRPVWVNRYTLYALIGTCMLSVLGTRWLPRFQRPLLAALVIPMFIQFWLVQRPLRPDWRSVIEVVNDGRPAVLVLPHEVNTLKGQIAGPIGGFSPVAEPKWKCCPPGERRGAGSSKVCQEEFERALKNSGGWLIICDGRYTESTTKELRKHGYVMDEFQVVANAVQPISIWNVHPVRVNLHKAPLVGFVRPKFAR
jgi:uncharacterized membrane protein